MRIRWSDLVRQRITDVHDANVHVVGGDCDVTFDLEDLLCCNARGLFGSFVAG
jgi:hypothetical protein